jgi:hypothetical protein
MDKFAGPQLLNCWYSKEIPGSEALGGMGVGCGVGVGLGGVVWVGSGSGAVGAAEVTATSGGG